MILALTKFLTFFESRKIFTFSQLNSTNFKYNFKDKVMREQVNNLASKANTLNNLTENEFIMT